MGNMLVRRPDLWGAIVCQVPLLDMRRFNHLLAGASWMDEYGNPDLPDEWNFIRTFSPYHIVEKSRKYPRTLFTTSTRDDRVHPGHARKMVAKMKDQGHDVVYYENIEGGHGGAADNKQAAFMQALAYTFLWNELTRGTPATAVNQATEKIPAYRDDLAYIHDDGYGGFAREAASVLVSALGRARISEGLVLDLGCGSGILSAVVGSVGYRTLGIDISEAMIALARKHVPLGEFRVESVLSASLPRCVAVAAVGECLNYLFDPANTKPKLTKLYRRIHTALEPGGFFILDVAEPGRARGLRRAQLQGK